MVERAEAEARAALLLVGELLRRSMSIPELLAFADKFATTQPGEANQPAMAHHYAVDKAAGEVAMEKLRRLAAETNDNTPGPA